MHTSTRVRHLLTGSSGERAREKSPRTYVQHSERERESDSMMMIITGPGPSQITAKTETHPAPDTLTSILSVVCMVRGRKDGCLCFKHKNAFV